VWDPTYAATVHIPEHPSRGRFDPYVGSAKRWKPLGESVPDRITSERMQAEREQRRTRGREATGNTMQNTWSELPPESEDRLHPGLERAREERFRNRQATMANRSPPGSPHRQAVPVGEPRAAFEIQAADERCSSPCRVRA